ncbi:MAG: Glycogen debranching enzyme [uncultured Paraburkholderia sp.]|nr:MAG: Glycogen debranching enzyme [uncultured Paraburkholderia sp.]CAH2945519.1 MAG: Glycogen debranching enzyme [uncultured Paraburkholderia sp.]
MHRFTKPLCAWFACVGLLPACNDSSIQSSGTPASSSALSFRMDTGGQINAFYRQDKVAAHLLARSSTKPRLLVVFPAGNSGTGLWFDDTAQPVSWSLDSAPSALSDRDRAGRPLYGIGADLSVDTDALTIHEGLLSNVRFLRDFNGGATVPPQITTQPVVQKAGVQWQRDRVDGAVGYALRVSLRDGGNIVPAAGGKLVLRAPAGAHALRLHVDALSGETPMSPIAHADLLAPAANPDPVSQNVLEFLSFRDKLLAGSWQYDTYFGRDTLISVCMLMPVLQPATIEAGLTSVLGRLSDDGRVAHEEGIGEFALINNAKNNRPRDPTPTYDYKMIDGDYLLAPIAAAWLIDDARGQVRAAAYLAQRGSDGRTNGSRLAVNLLHVADTAKPFTQQPTVANLIRLRPGQIVGNWRDSTDGLGGGAYPYDVNAVLVPAALYAASAFLVRGLLDPYLDAGQRATLVDVANEAAVWKQYAPALFRVDVPAAQAATDVAGYAPTAGVPAGAAPDAPLSFYALSLDEQGAPVAVMNSDGGFALLFGTPPQDELQRIVADVTRPFPAGLVTDVGMLVSNPAFASPSLWPKFTSSAYHGAVVWSWQQAMWVAGLDRQLRREDLSGPTRALLTQARLTIWRAISNARDMRTSEMWTWSYTGGHYQADAFDTRSADATEANAAQLWSTTYLAIRDPQLRTGRYWWQASQHMQDGQRGSVAAVASR